MDNQVIRKNDKVGDRLTPRLQEDKLCLVPVLVVDMNIRPEKR